MEKSQPDPSLADALVAPLKALAAAQRELSAATLASFRAGLVTDAAGNQRPRKQALVLGAPGEPVTRIDLPALALAPVSNLAITGARFELTWEPSAVVLAEGGGTARIHGRPAAPRAVTRPTDRAPKVDVRVRLRGQGPSEGRRRIDDRLTSR